MPSTLRSVITRVEQFVQLIVLWLLDAEDQEPSIPLEIRHPLEAREGKVENSHRRLAHSRLQAFDKRLSIFGFDLQGPRQRHVQRQRNTQLRRQRRNQLRNRYVFLLLSCVLSPNDILDMVYQGVQTICFGLRRDPSSTLAG